MDKECPNCGWYSKGKAKIMKDFGLRKVNGKEVPQSYCKDCRKKKSKKKPTVEPKPETKVEEIKKKDIKFFRTTKEKTGKIIRFNKSELEDLLNHLNQSGAMDIGVDIKEIGWMG